MAINYNSKMEEIISKLDKNKKNNLFLHVCCAPCCSQVLKLLNEFFDIYIIFYNPNIDSLFEFELRYFELNKLLKLYNNVKVIYNLYNHFDFLNNINGFENEKEGGSRCVKCFELRIDNSFKIADNYIKDNNLLNCNNYFTTTLTISPHKNADIINSIGEKLSLNYNNLFYLYSDFKKNNGYQSSIIISKELNLYRQNYCGCEFAK